MTVSWHLLLNQCLFHLFGVAVLGIQSIAMELSISVKHSIVSLFGSLCNSFSLYFSSNFSPLALSNFQSGVLCYLEELGSDRYHFVYLPREVDIDSWVG